MQVRCYTCGLKLHDGMPRLEELSAQQMEVVSQGLPPMESLNLVLEGTPFDGMSWNSFCTGCQILLKTIPSRAWEDVEGHGWKQKAFYNKTCACGCDSWSHVFFLCACGQDVGSNSDTPAANRAWRRHLGLVLRPN